MILTLKKLEKLLTNYKKKSKLSNCSYKIYLVMIKARYLNICSNLKLSWKGLLKALNLRTICWSQPWCKTLVRRIKIYQISNCQLLKILARNNLCLLFNRIKNQSEIYLLLTTTWNQKVLVFLSQLLLMITKTDHTKPRKA